MTLFPELTLEEGMINDCVFCVKDATGIKGLFGLVRLRCNCPLVPKKRRYWICDICKHYLPKSPRL